MSNQLKAVLKHQDKISEVANNLLKIGCVGDGNTCGDKHPAWPHTSELPSSICRITAIQLAENRFKAVKK